ncbi:hypothetical protein L6452_16543 [Arctium lappa]|uniref:Uncharacterized protein n=1 Tax=Arctium lappa TaxID=4217 RepID=A0ACB9C0T2_ARCLA|nr:hypothetical protein L6452_16543 [Arctium lappa]
MCVETGSWERGRPVEWIPGRDAPGRVGPGREEDPGRPGGWKTGRWGPGRGKNPGRPGGGIPGRALQEAGSREEGCGGWNRAITGDVNEARTNKMLINDMGDVSTYLGSDDRRGWRSCPDSEVTVNPVTGEVAFVPTASFQAGEV